VKILFVCLGNICRSPTAEGVVRAIAEREYPGLKVELDSAGTADYHVGEAPDRRTIAVARRRGYEIGSLRARQLQRDDFNRFDHILAMDRANLSSLERLLPEQATVRIGLFMDFAPDSGFIEVPDPYYGGSEDFERVLDLCELAGRGLLQKLATGAP
jgi:protein-tyrosine phosphatase